MTTDAKNVLQQMLEAAEQRKARRDELKSLIASATTELKSMNEEDETEKNMAKSIAALLTNTRKRRASKAPIEVDPTSGEPKPTKKRGRPAKNTTPQAEVTQS